MEVSKGLTEQIPLIYVYIGIKLVEKYGRSNRVLTGKDILEVIARNVHNIPRRYDFFIVQEFVRYGFLEKVDTSRFEVSNKELDFKCRKVIKIDELLKLKIKKERFKFIGSEVSKAVRSAEKFIFW